jgi:hypothetical protein
MANPFQRQKKIERRKARQTAETLAPAELPPIVMAAPVSVQTSEAIPEFDDVHAGDDPSEYPRICCSPEPIAFTFPENAGQSQ